MSEREVVQLGFEQGLNREFDTQLAGKSARRLLNWQPQMDGALRVRRSWERASLIGKPAVSEVGSIGVFPVQEGFMTPIRRQRRKRMRRGGNLLGITCSWPDDTLEGSTLIAVLSYSAFNAAGTHDPTSATVVTTPANWVSIGAVHSPDAPSSVSLRFYKIVDAAERSGDEEFTFDVAVNRAALEILEWRGIADTTPEDVFKSNSGNSVNPDTDFSASTDGDFPKQLVLAAVAGRTADQSIKLELDGSDYYDFRDRGEEDGPQHSVGREDFWLNMVVARKVINGEGPQRFHGHYDTTNDEDDAKSNWVAALVTFKAKERSPEGDKDYYVAANIAADAHTLYAIDRDQIDTGTWDELGTVLARQGDSARYPLAYVPGFGGLLISSADIMFGGTKRGLVQWDGDTLIRINRSPLARALALYKSRFYAAGSRNDPNILYYSALGDQTMWDLDEWRIAVGSDGDALLDIATVNEGLLMAKRDSLYMFVGNPRAGEVVQLAGGGGMEGRCICAIPGGAIVAGQEHIWLYQGGAPQLLSRALDDWWINEDRTHVHTGYVNGLAYIAGADEDTHVVYDTRDQIWWVDQSPVPMNVIASSYNRELLGGATGVPAEFLFYQKHPGTARDRDALAEDFEVTTQEYMLGSPSRPTTPLWLYIAYQKRNYQTGHNPVVVTPIYDGIEGTTREITEAHPASGTLLGNGDHRLRLDVGIKDRSAAHKVQYRITHAATADNSTVFDIEAIELMYEREEVR